MNYPAASPLPYGGGLRRTRERLVEMTCSQGPAGEYATHRETPGDTREEPGRKHLLMKKPLNTSTRNLIGLIAADIGVACAYTAALCSQRPDNFIYLGIGLALGVYMAIRL